MRAIMRKHNLEFEEKDIIANPAFRWEMEQKSGQPLSPCVVVNDVMLPDVSGDEVEAYMLDKSLISPNDNSADAPTESACTDEQHAAMDRAAGKINFEALGIVGACLGSGGGLVIAGVSHGKPWVDPR